MRIQKESLLNPVQMLGEVKLEGSQSTYWNTCQNDVGIGKIVEEVDEEKQRRRLWSNQTKREKWGESKCL